MSEVHDSAAAAYDAALACLTDDCTHDDAADCVEALDRLRDVVASDARREGVAAGMRQASKKLAELAKLGTAVADGTDDHFGSCTVCAGDSAHEEDSENARACPVVAWRASVADLPEACR